MNKDEMCKHLWSNEIIGRECTISAEDIPTVAKAIMRTIPMKPLVFMYEPFMHCGCPVCGSYIRAPRTTPGDYEYQQYCDMCGQKIDWEDLANENT